MNKVLIVEDDITGLGSVSVSTPDDAALTVRELAKRITDSSPRKTVIRHVTDIVAYNHNTNVIKQSITCHLVRFDVYNVFKCAD